MLIFSWTELRVWIRERDLKSAEDGVQIAKVFLSARTGSRRTIFVRANFAERSKSNGVSGVVILSYNSF